MPLNINRTYHSTTPVPKPEIETIDITTKEARDKIHAQQEIIGTFFGTKHRLTPQAFANLQRTGVELEGGKDA